MLPSQPKGLLILLIESVPLKRLLELSDFRKRRWEFRDGWLILEAL
jgi:hypothetical protein